MNNAMELSLLDGKEVVVVTYAANRTDEVPGGVSVIGEDFDTIPEETAKLLAKRLGIPGTTKVFSVHYGRTGVYDAEFGYHMDIRIRKGETHWLCVTEHPMKSIGGPLEIDHIDFGDGVYGLVIPIAKAANLINGRLARGWDPLLV